MTIRIHESTWHVRCTCQHQELTRFVSFLTRVSITPLSANHFSLRKFSDSSNLSSAELRILLQFIEIQWKAARARVNIEELVANLSTYKDQLQQSLKGDQTQAFCSLGRISKVAPARSGRGMILCSLGNEGGEVFKVRKLLNDDPKNSEFLDMEKELAEKSRATDDDDGDKFSVGTKVQAVWSEDGEWYDATIEALTPNGYYVSYDEWGNKEEVDPDNVRPIQEGSADPLLEAEKIAVATKEALKRKIAQAASKDFQPWTVPQKLQIDPNDPEDVKAAKRKKIHAFKSKMRMEAKEVTQNKRQNAWQQFQTTKGRAKKVGFFSGRKRESIFKSPDDPFGKVGVTGSGKGLTEFQKREKHLHLKGANMESVDD
ncbi:UNVERIFIED_CONTAM: Survival of motor neuron-related-splicing factor 30 [Sesamum latifolium]|uniref:Survival of motor neuron-related-splicing factor 30 n=1 Tax=Sesamum latifolium TaxID=2727402 RepID=A0AAW2XLE9_9LAMI